MKRIIHEKIIEMKLQQGDYVEGLTEEQFDELMGIENHPMMFEWNKYDTKQTSSLLYNGRCLNLKGFQDDAVTKLSFTEFKQRAINTFER